MVLFGESKGARRRRPASAPCELTCCSDPGGRPIRDIVAPGDDCAAVDWDRLAPYTGRAPAEGLTEAGFAAGGLSVPLFAPFGSAVRGRLGG
jgi:hypothetical protein